MNNLKLEKGFILDEITKLYENESIGVKLHKELKLAISKEILILVIFAIVGIFLKNYEIVREIYLFVSLVFIVIWNIFTLNNIMKKFGRNTNYKITNMLNNFSKIINEARIKDINLLRKILVKNNLYKTEILNTMIEYYKEGSAGRELNLRKTIWKILEIFTSLVLGILGVYVSIYSSTNLEFSDLLLGVLKIIEKFIIIYIIVVILYVIYKLKNYSIKYCYVYPELYKMLLQLKITKLKSSKK